MVNSQGQPAEHFGHADATLQWIKYSARGFRNRENIKDAIMFHCGGLDLYPHEAR